MKIIQGSSLEFWTLVFCSCGSFKQHNTEQSTCLKLEGTMQCTAIVFFTGCGIPILIHTPQIESISIFARSNHLISLNLDLFSSTSLKSFHYSF